MIGYAAALAIACAAGLPQDDAMVEGLHLETPKPDAEFQQARSDYELHLTQLRQRLAVRASPSMRRLVLSTPVLITNRGRAEAVTVGDTIYIDIALLDLVYELSFEVAVSHVKADLYHQLEFTLAYASALNGDKLLPQTDRHNTARYTEEQNKYLWQEMEIARVVTFDNILGFVLAHEIAHLELGHQARVERDFPQQAHRTMDNAAWIAARRKMELEADSVGSRTCIDALLVPAQVLVWFDLNEIRRRYYGVAPEYPTMTQRLDTIQVVCDELMGENELGDLRQFAPLAPHRDVAAVDYAMFLEEYRRVRALRSKLLITLDEQLADLLGQGESVADAAEYVIGSVQLQRAMLRGATNPAPLEDALAIARTEGGPSEAEIAKLSPLFEAAGMQELALFALETQLTSEPVDWPALAQHIDVVRSSQGQLADGIDFKHLLTNTCFRWLPEMFDALKEALPDTETAAKALEPRSLEIPLPLQPTLEERLDALRVWDGSF